MSDSPTSAVLRTLRDCQLLDATQLDEVSRQLAGRAPRPQTLCQDLVRCNWLTNFQAQAVLKGKAAELSVGAYRVLEPIASGGAGCIYKARHAATNKVVALKILRHDVRRDNDTVLRFQREIEVTSQLAHPNLIHAIEAGPMGNSLALVMEYVEGADLESTVQRSGPLAAPLACEYIRQAALGLQYAHEKGLVHRDIKPGNLLVTAAGCVKILDLGLARFEYLPVGSTTADLTIAGGKAVTQGTPDYMAPEQALDFHGADVRSDLYSLGCTFYFLLTGQPPFAGGSLAEKLLKHQQVAPPPLEKACPGVPAGVSAIVMKLLAKQPADRFQTPAELVTALDEVLVRTASAATRPDIDNSTMFAAPGLTAPAGRRRVMLVVAGLGGLAIVGAVLVLALRSDESATATTIATVPPTTPAIDTKIAAKGTTPGAELVKDIVTANRKQYTLGIARLKEPCYIDRAYVIQQIAASLDGGVLIRTACDDKHAGNANQLTFTLTAPASVNVAFDPRAPIPPAWLTEGGWQLTADRMAFTVQKDMKVYRKKFPAGKVTLGGNLASKAEANYLVVVTPDR